VGRTGEPGAIPYSGFRSYRVHYHGHMSDMDMTVILDDLAAGRINASEAKRRIDALGLGDGMPGGATGTEPSAEWPAPPAEAAPEEAPKEEPHDVPPQAPPTPPKADKINGVSKVYIKATGRKVRIVADRHVSTAAAEDVHQVRRQGSVLKIMGDREFTGVVDAISWARTVRGLDDVKALGIGKELTIRVNPALEVEIDLTGCSLVVTDLPHIGKVRLTAGVATITGARVVSDVLVQAGQVTVAGRFTDGWSRVRCESGQVILEASRDSDVTIRAEAQLGRISWDDCNPTDNEVKLGQGTARFDVGLVVGHAAVRVV